jgi:uncharacterized protein YndB with AHSA1/START domain
VTSSASASTSTSTRISDREYVMSRVFNAPRPLVFRAYTDPEMVPNWWGQRSSTTIVDKMEVKPGGAWRYIQRGPNGEEYAFRGEYLEVVPPERLVNTFEFEPMPGHIVTDTTVFEEIDGKTRITVTSTFATREDLDGMIASGMESGANESWDRLDELIASLA